MKLFQNIFGKRPAAVDHLADALAAKESLPFQSDGTPVNEDPEIQPEPLNPTESTEPVNRPGLTELPVLKGTPAQVKWAQQIRQAALALAWPPETWSKLSAINDATWWIANKSIPRTMKFKDPLPKQTIYGTGQMELTSKAKTVAAVAAEIRGEQPTPVLTTQKRLNEATAWAARMANNPDLANLAILALLTRLYSEPAMRLPLNRRVETALKEADKLATRTEAADIAKVRELLKK